MNIVPIQSVDDPRIAIYRNQRDAWLRARATGGTGLAPTTAPSVAEDAAAPTAPGLFMAEGELVVRALIDSPYPVESLLITPSRLRTLQDAIARLNPAVPVYLAGRPLLADIVGFDLHRGVLAAGRREGRPSASEVIGSCRRLLVMEDLANHDNVGGLLRSLAALGTPPVPGGPAPPTVPGGSGAPTVPGGPGTPTVPGGPGIPTVPAPAAGALLSPRTCDPFYRKALRVSMGHALRLPLATLAPWPEGLSRLREAGWRVVALTPGAEPLMPPILPRSPRPDLAPERIALLVGAEGPGLSAGALALADERRSIPMAPGVDSLNVTVAASLAMWALWSFPRPLTPDPLPL